MPIERERVLVARCSEPKTEEIFEGLLRWTLDIGLPDFDIKSPLVQLLGEHHQSFKGHKHGNFALFINKQLALQSPNLDKNNIDLASIKILYPLSIGVITVARQYDKQGDFIGFRAYGYIKPGIK